MSDGEEKWEMSQLPFADNKVLAADSKKKLEWLVEEFGRISRRWKSMLKVVKRKIMRTVSDGTDGEKKMMTDCQVLEDFEVL